MNIVLLSPTKKKGVLNLPLIEFNFLSPKINFLKYDYLIFTSKTAVKAVNKISKEWTELPSLTVGEKTAKEVENSGGKVVFTGNGYGESLLPEILKYRDKKILFARGKDVASDLKEMVTDDVEIDEAILYETICKKQELVLGEDSVIIFTSPSTVNCFFENYQWKESYKAVAIGTTTAKELPKDLEIHIPDTTSFDECIKLANQI